MKMILAFLLTFIIQVISQSSDTAVMEGTLYDFANADSRSPQRHPDFNSFLCDVRKGLVQNTIGVDRKPVPVDPPTCWTSADTFNQWFRDTPGVNIKFNTTISATWDESKQAYVYTNGYYFPLDGQGYGNDDNGHNFGFCLEIHSQFTYMGGEKYHFEGDDDVWVFINDELVIDLGGVHPTAYADVDLDSLSLTVGNTYPFDFFFCERHTTGSDMGFSTNVQLYPCGMVDTDRDGIFDNCDNCPYGNIDLSLTIGSVAGKTVSFNYALGTTVRNPVDVVFDFGDGTTTTSSASMDSSVSHTYADQGEYTVTATVVASGCGSDTDSVDTKAGIRKAPTCTTNALVGLVY